MSKEETHPARAEEFLPATSTNSSVSATTMDAPRYSLQSTFASLKYRNYRLWFIGQLASLVGTWMQATAQGFLVFELTQSPAYLGLVGFASGIPSWVFMLYGGVVAYRIPRRTILIITQTAMMILAFILAGLTFSGLVAPWHIVLLAFVLGIANAFDAPSRHAFILELVERQDMGNAIALNASMFQLAVVIGPAVAGLTYAWIGPAWCFTINGISFIAVIIALLMMRIKRFESRPRTTSAWQDMTEGFRYILGHSRIRAIIALGAVMSFFAIVFSTLSPDWAVVILGGDATTNGLLQSARGVGSLMGALLIAALGRFNFRGKLLTTGSLVLPISLLAFAAVRTLPLSLLTLVVVGWGFMVFYNMCNILVQSDVEDAFRGRVMGIYSLNYGALVPMGALLGGFAADQVGAPWTVAAGAAIALAFAVFIYFAVPQLNAMQ